MPQITYNGKLPSPEQFQKDLQDARAGANPVDDLLDMWQKLQGFEQKYKMTSVEFYQQYQDGVLNDELQHCLAWVAAFEIFKKTKRQLEASLMRSAVRSEEIEDSKVRTHEPV